MDTQLFQRIDQDGDGQLTVEELAGAQETLRSRARESREGTRWPDRP